VAAGRVRYSSGRREEKRSFEMGASLASAGLVNYPLVAALLAFALAQSSKFFTTW
jgi:hypothetical protein